jgi:hypothetical protein
MDCDHPDLTRFRIVPVSDCDDQLRASRGILGGCLVGAGIWVALAVAGYWIFFR